MLDDFAQSDDAAGLADALAQNGKDAAGKHAAAAEDFRFPLRHGASLKEFGAKRRSSLRPVGRKSHLQKVGLAQCQEA
jgi:hypothetical protein